MTLENFERSRAPHEPQIKPSSKVPATEPEKINQLILSIANELEAAGANPSFVENFRKKGVTIFYDSLKYFP